MGSTVSDEPLQLELMSVPRRLFAATPSRLTTFDCPRRYWFNYLARPAPSKGPPWAHNTVGAAVHLALSKWWQLPWQAQAAQWVQHYLNDEIERGDTNVEPRGVERTVATRTTRLAISGRVDRIDERGRELVIVDYKTGRSKLTSDDARGSVALALYAIAAERTLHQPCRQVELHHLPTGTIASFEHTEQSLAQHLERAEQNATDIMAATDTVAGGADPLEVFEPNPGPSCSWCDFRKHCPAGQAVSTARNSWDALGTLTADQA
jgi:putative RecB family exonuclease